MKKTFLFISLLGIVFLSCNKTTSDEALSNAVTQIKVMIEGTKTSLTRASSVVWREGDQMAVYTSDNTFERFTLYSGANTSNAVFTANSSITPNKFAIYPYSAAGEYTTATHTETINMPVSYTWGDQALGGPMLALVSDSDLAIFKQIVGYFKFDIVNIPATASKLVFFTENQVITGEFGLDVENEWPGIYTWDATAYDTDKRTVTVNFTANEQSSRSFYIPVPSGNYTKFMVSLQNADGDDLITPKTWTSSGTPIRIDKHTLKVIPAFSCSDVSIVLWEGAYTAGNWDHWDQSVVFSGGNKVWSAFPDDTVIRVYFDENDVDGRQMQINYHDSSEWKQMASVNLANGQSTWDITLTSSLKAAVAAFDSFAFNGYNVKMTKVEALDNRPETVIWTGAFDLDTGNMTDLKKELWQSAKTGTTVTIYATEDGDYADNWRNLYLKSMAEGWPEVVNLSHNADGSVFRSYSLTSADVTTLKANGMAIQGTGITITKITLR